MPTLSRPEVDVLDGLTTAIIVDQERMGANVRSTVGTATDANAMLRVLFSRLGQPHIGSSNAFSFNVPSVRGGGAITIERGAGKAKTESRTFTVTGGMCPRCEGIGTVSDIDLDAALRRHEVDRRGRHHHPRLQGRQLVDRRDLHRVGLRRPEQADPRVHQEGARRLPLQGADQGQGQRRQPHLRGVGPQGAEVVPVQGPRRRCSHTSGPSWTGRPPSPRAPIAAALA